MTTVLAEELLRLPVRVRGIDVGKAVDLLVDPLARRVLGLDVLCRDESHRFLPLTAAVFDDQQITVESALMLLAEDQLAFYRTRGRSLRELMPMLDHVVVERDGTLELVSDDAA
jgi:hypothetical protein